MKLRRVLIGAMWATFLAFSATAETTVIRPPDASGPQICSGARKSLIIDLGPIDNAVSGGPQSGHVVIFYPPTEAGWASRRLLSRFRVAGAGAGEACAAVNKMDIGRSPT